MKSNGRPRTDGGKRKHECCVNEDGDDEKILASIAASNARPFWRLSQQATLMASNAVPATRATSVRRMYRTSRPAVSAPAAAGVASRPRPVAASMIAVGQQFFI
jgi:hypothetical protein